MVESSVIVVLEAGGQALTPWFGVVLGEHWACWKACNMEEVSAEDIGPIARTIAFAMEC